MVSDAVLHDLLVHVGHRLIEFDLHGVTGEFHAARHRIAHHNGKTEILTVTADVHRRHLAGLDEELRANTGLGQTDGRQLNLALGN